MSKIDIDKFICSLFKERIELLSIIKSAIKDQGLAYKDGKLVEIEPKQRPLVETEYDPYSLPVGDDSNLPTFNEDMFHPCTEKKENKEEEAPSEFIYEFLNIYHHSTPSDYTEEKLARYKKDITKIYRLAEKCLQPKFEKVLSEVKGNLEDEYEKGYKKAIEDLQNYVERNLKNK